MGAMRQLAPFVCHFLSWIENTTVRARTAVAPLKPWDDPPCSLVNILVRGLTEEMKKIANWRNVAARTFRLLFTTWIENTTIGTRTAMAPPGGSFLGL